MNDEVRDKSFNSLKEEILNYTVVNKFSDVVIT